jgi:hypothetical protein
MVETVAHTGEMTREGESSIGIEQAGADVPYGETVRVPVDGTDDGEVPIDVPAPHGTNGGRFGESVTVLFWGIDANTGQS